MKTQFALVVAIGLGLAGAVLNWLYLNQKAAEVERIAFLGIKKEMSIRKGEVFRRDHFEAVHIPKNAAANLGVYFEKYDAIGGIADTGTKATRDYEGGELLLHQDLKTPPPELKPGPNEGVLFVPVDTRSFIPSLVNPGDFVYFLVAVGGSSSPTPPPASSQPAGAAAPPPSSKDEDPNADLPAAVDAPQAPSRGELIGPFRVLSIGNRLGSTDVFKGYGIPQQQENVMTVAVAMKDNRMDERAVKLWELLQKNAIRQAAVVLTPRTDKKP